MKFIKTFEKFQSINESSFYSINYNDIVTPNYIKVFLRSDDGKRCREEFFDFVIEEEDKNDEESDIKFKEYALEWLKDRFEHVEYKLDSVISYGGYIDIYRVMNVQKNWIEHLKNEGKRLGIYWSFDENSAEAHWGRDGIEALIKTTINQELVDWKQTFIANMDYSLGDEENEITLFKNTPIKIESITINGIEQDISEIEDKIFLA